MFKAVSLAVAGSFYPVGLLFVLRFIAARRGTFLASLFLIGGALGCLLVSVLELVLLNSLPFDKSTNPGPNGTVYIVLGAGLLVLCAIYARRRPAPAEIDGETIPRPDPGPGKAFLTGLVVYSPGLGLIAAVKALFDAKLSGATLVVGLIVCIVIILWMAEVPILASVIAPVRSEPVLRRSGSFIAVHARFITIAIGLAFGAYLIADGIWTVAGN